MNLQKRFAYLMLACTFPFSALAAVTELVIEQRELAFDGLNFGASGRYERLVGYAVGELDPSHPSNAGIVNIDKAPLNANGRVEYRVDVHIIKPLDVLMGNGWILYDVNNRGRMRYFRFNAGGGGNDLPSAEDAGTGFLMREGYTIVASGWQGDVDVEGRLRASFPVATELDGSPIVGLNRDEFIDSSNESPFTVTLSYPANDITDGSATLTVRENEQDPRQMPAGLGFTYLDDRHIEITRPDDPSFDGGAIYEFIYEAKDPQVLGIGFAATRDVISFLRYDGSTMNPVAVSGQSAISHVMAEGISQSGRFLRDFIYQGFNADEEGRQLLDGAIPIIAGSRKTFTNYEFAQPGAFSRQHENHTFPGDQFPFTYAVLTDPVTGMTDSILARCEATSTCPKVMHVDSDTEIWQARGSLVVTDGNPAGPLDIELPENVRAYLMTSTQHGPDSTPSFGICQQLSNPLNYYDLMPAIVVALEEWVADGIEPPASRYGSADHGTLVPFDQGSTGFPDIPGVNYNGNHNRLTVNDFSTQPPTEGEAYGVLATKMDEDGNSLPGIRHPLLEAPVATHTGWNLRAPGQAEGELCSLTGSYIPFAATKEERVASGDPRLSLEERYGNHGRYVSRVARAANALVRDRLLLHEDAERIVSAAARGETGRAPEDDGGGD